jgi:hypothetical protein
LTVLPLTLISPIDQVIELVLALKITNKVFHRHPELAEFKFTEVLDADIIARYFSAANSVNTTFGKRPFLIVDTPPKFA